MFIRIAALLVLGSAAAAPAAVVSYTSAVDFGAVSTVAAATDFESTQGGNRGGAFDTGGIRFTILPGAYANIYLYVSPPGDLGQPADPQSTVLDANGDENFRIERADGAAFTTIGFNVVTNQFGPPVVSLYDAGNALIGAVTLAQSPNSYGFIGLTSTTEIAYAVFQVDRGWIENTAIDNVTLGTLAAVPEPASWAMLVCGFGTIGAIMRRRERAVAGVS